jgi:hypothetical protein
MTPEDCDLRSMAWFPLHHKRLRRSSWWLKASDQAKAISVELWCEAYEQVPAASLPDDDIALSVAAGFGRRDLSGWLAVKAEVMGPWVLCADGRWYHPTLAEIAVETWSTLQDRRRREREKKRRKRGSPGEDGDDPRGTGVVSPGEIATQDITGQDTTEDHKSADADSSASPPHVQVGNAPDAAPVPEGPDYGEEPEMVGVVTVGARHAADLALVPARIDEVRQAFDLYNEAAREHGWSVAEKLTDDRRKKLKARLRSSKGLVGWMQALKQVTESDFLMGRRPGRDGPFKMHLDFLLQSSSFQRLIEGRYASTGGGNGAGTSFGRGARSRADDIGSFHRAFVGSGDEGDDYG